MRYEHESAIGYSYVTRHVLKIKFLTLSSLSSSCRASSGHGSPSALVLHYSDAGQVQSSTPVLHKDGIIRTDLHFLNNTGTRFSYKTSFFPKM